MKTLIIVRHAKSSWNDPALKDFDRPLNLRGEKDAPDMGKRIELRNIVPDLILSSPANRAYSTASIIAQFLSYPAKNIQTNPQIYHASSAELLEVLKSQENTINTLMFFGHNPGFTSLANFLTNEALENIPTSGAMGIQLNISDWKDIGKNKGNVLFYDYPKKPFNSKFLS